MRMSGIFVQWCVIAGLLSFVSPASSSNRGTRGISFVKEHISFIICAADTIEIKGMYWFSNTGHDNYSTVIFYPFPLDTNGEYPHRISVFRGDKHTAINYRTLPLGIEWQQIVPAYSIDSLYVVYRQKVTSGIGQYIVSTTRLWSEPLKQADFIVHVPSPFTITFWSFQADSVSFDRSKAVLYHAHFSPFRPEGEMEVRWR